MRSLAVASALVALSPAVARAADNCTPSRAMVVLDKSSSMVTGTIAGTPKWDIAVASLDVVATSYQSAIELGLMLFPAPNECAPGSMFVEPALGTRDAIMNALGDPPPASGNWTPMSQTLDVAATLPALTDPARPRYVILITDGWQWCYPYDASTRFDPVTSVANLKTLGVTTYVVGFGDAVDALVLNQAAVAAGTAIAGCDPTGDTPSAANPCYQRAESSAELLGALDAIALHIAAESCDGLDNDCDGVVDEEITRECATACGAGVESCAMGAWVGCTAQTPAAEACDGLDNDCDGTVDPGCSCVEGQTRTCGDGEGACAPGQQTCGTEGTWGACEGATDPAAELCNGVDDDCDGIVDEMDGTPLCPEGGSCHDGTCVPPTPAAEDGGDESGCGCRAGGRPNGLGGALLAAVVGLAFVRRRRR